MSISLEEKLAVVKREIAMRRQVYPNQVRLGRMKQDDADYQLAVMEAVAADYEGAIARKREKQGSSQNDN